MSTVEMLKETPERKDRAERFNKLIEDLRSIGRELYEDVKDLPKGQRSAGLLTIGTMLRVFDIAVEQHDNRFITYLNEGIDRWEKRTPNAYDRLLKLASEICDCSSCSAPDCPDRTAPESAAH
jgi:hypothetical protein